MKRIFVFIIVAVLLFSVGFGGGVFVGRTWLNPEGTASVRVEEPGPIYFVGDFITNLAGGGGHVVNFQLALELSGPRVMEIISSPSWVARIRNEVILLAKDRVFDDLTSAEGIMELAEDIKRTINSMMPPVRDREPVVRVLFERFVLQ